MKLWLVFVFPKYIFHEKNIFLSIEQTLILFCFRAFWPQLLLRFVNQTSDSLGEVGVTEGRVIQRLSWHASVVNFVVRASRINWQFAELSLCGICKLLCCRLKDAKVQNVIWFVRYDGPATSSGQIRALRPMQAYMDLSLSTLDNNHLILFVVLCLYYGPVCGKNNNTVKTSHFPKGINKVCPPLLLLGVHRGVALSWDAHVEDRNFKMFSMKIWIAMHNLNAPWTRMCPFFHFKGTRDTFGIAGRDVFSYESLMNQRREHTSCWKWQFRHSAAWRMWQPWCQQGDTIITPFKGDSLSCRSVKGYSGKPVTPGAYSESRPVFFSMNLTCHTSDFNVFSSESLVHLLH